MTTGYSDVHVLEIILRLAVNVISNYSNYVNHSEVDEALAAHTTDKAT